MSVVTISLDVDAATGTATLRNFGGELKKTGDTAMSAKGIINSVFQGFGIGTGIEVANKFWGMLKEGAGLLPGLIASTGSYAGELLKVEAAFGVSAKAQTVMALAGDDVGTSFEAQTAALGNMAAFLDKYPEKLGRIGMSYADLKGMKPEEQFEAIGKKLVSITDDTTRLTAAQEIFGKKVAAEVLPLFSGAMDDAREKAEKFALSMDEGTAKSVDRLADNIAFTGTAFQGMGRQIVSAIADSEPFQLLVEGILDAIAWLSRTIRDNRGEITTWINTGILAALEALMMLTPAIGWLVDAYTGLSIIGATVIKFFKDQADAAIFAANVLIHPIDATKTLMRSLAENQRELNDSIASSMKRNTELQGNVAAGTQGLNGFIEKMEKAAQTHANTGAAAEKHGSGLKIAAGNAEELAKKQAAATKEAERYAEAVQKIQEGWGIGTNTERLNQLMDALEGAFGGDYRLIPESVIQKAQADLKATGEAGVVAAKAVQKAWEDAAGVIELRANAISKAASKDLLGARGVDKNAETIWNEVAALEAAQKRTKELEATMLSLQGSIDPATFEEVAKKLGLWKKNAEETKDEIEETVPAVTRMANLLQSAASLKDIIGGKLGDLFSGGASMLAGIQGLFGDMKDKAGKSLGSVFGQIFDGKDIMKNLSSAIPAIGALAGPVISAVSGWFEARKLKSIGKQVGLTLGTEIAGELDKEMLKAIEASSKKLGISVGNAALLKLPEIISGSDKSPIEFTTQYLKLLQGVASGAIPAAQGITALGKAFTQMTESVKDAGLLGKMYMGELVNQAEAAGVRIPEITAHVKNMAGEAAPALKTLFDSIDKDGGARFASLEAITLAWVAKLKAQGASALEIMTLLGPALDAAYEAAQRSGSKASAAFEELLAKREKLTNESNAPILANVDAMNQLAAAAAAAGINSQEAMSGFAAEALNAKAALEAAGFTELEALEQIAPTLAYLNELYKAGKIQLDEKTLAMINQAEKAGLLEAQLGPQEAMLAVLKEVLDVLRQIAGLPSGKTFDYDVNYNYHHNGQPGPGSDDTGGGDGLPQMARGGISTGPMVAQLHGTPGNPELVAPVSSLIHGIGRAILGGGGGAGGLQVGSVTINVDGGGTLADAYAKGKAAATAFIQNLKDNEQGIREEIAAYVPARG